VAARGERAARARRIPGQRVLMMMRDTPEFAAAWLGALHAGAVAIALNSKLSEAEYRHIRADSGARLAIVEDVFAWARPDLTAEEASAGGLAIAGRERGAGAVLARGVGARETRRRALRGAGGDAGFLALFFRHTGKPKGIIHAHRSLLPAGQGQRDVVGPRRRRKQFRHLQAVLRLCAGAWLARPARHRRHRDPGTQLARC